MKFGPSGLSVQYGSEPILILAVQWARNGSFLYYADKDLDQSRPGKILSINTIESVLSLDGNKSSVSLEISLDDSDGEILDLFNNVDIHKKPAYLYQSFGEGGGLFLIFQGEVVSNCLWDDQQRTFKLTVVSKLEDRDAGFSPEEGSFADLPVELIGKAWPMAFGDIVRAPALQITKPPQGVIADPLAIPDNSLGAELVRLSQSVSELQAIAMFYFLAALQAYFSDLPDIGDQMTDLGNQALQAAAQVQGAIGSVGGVQNAQATYARTTVTVVGDFPIALKGTFQIGEGYFTGTLSKSNSGISHFHITGVYNPKDTSGGLPPQGPPSKGNFLFVQAGSQLKFMGNYPVKYVVNILGAQVHQVYAYRQFEGLRRLTAIPPSYYHTELIDTGKGTNGVSYNATAIVFDRPLSYRAFEEWDDEIFVSYTSNISGNFQEVLTFLITTYTTFAIDGDSLFEVPVFNLNFVLNETKNILSLLTELCWQCKVAIWLTEGKFYFTYLPRQPNQTKTVTLSDILEDSFQLSFSDTESLITKLVGTWRFDYSLQNPNKVIIRYNVEKYGTHEQTYDFYALNIGTAVESSMSFWIYRLGNTWKQIRLRVPLDYLVLENFDAVILSSEVVSTYKLGNGSMPALVKNVFYDPNNYYVELELELPVKLGTSSVDPYYWCAGSDVTLTIIRLMEAQGLGTSQWSPNAIPLPSGGGGGDGVSPGGGGGDAGGDDDNSAFYDFNQILIGPLALPNPNVVTGEIYNAGERINKDLGGYLGEYIAPPTNFPTNVPAINPVDVPAFQYEYGNYNFDFSGSKDDAPCFPGQVQSGENGEYKCLVYPYGLGGKTRRITAKLLQGDDRGKDKLDKGTWALFSKAGGDYYFQVPVWL